MSLENKSVLDALVDRIEGKRKPGPRVVTDEDRKAADEVLGITPEDRQAAAERDRLARLGVQFRDTRWA